MYKVISSGAADDDDAELQGSLSQTSHPSFSSIQLQATAYAALGRTTAKLII